MTEPKTFLNGAITLANGVWLTGPPAIVKLTRMGIGVEIRIVRTDGGVEETVCNYGVCEMGLQFYTNHRNAQLRADELNREEGYV